MHDLSVILTLTGGLAAALVFGAITRRLGLSSLVGYLLAGIAVGPHTPGFVADGRIASQMADIGVMPHVIETALNHQSGHKRGPAGVYNRSRYEREVRNAMALWSDHVRAMVEGGERKVITLSR